MRRMLPFLFLSFLSIPVISTAQSWFNNDHTWTYQMVGGFAGVNDYFNLHVDIDTTINGQACKKMVITGAEINILQPRFVYEDNDRVFLYQSYADSFAVLYDFNLLVGDTLRIHNKHNTFRYLIEAVDTVQAGPLSLRRQQVEQLNSDGTPSGWKFDILEKIGNVGRPFELTMPICSYFFQDESPYCYSAVDGFDLKFICFQSQAGVYTPYNLNCLILDVANPVDAANLRLYPNPVEDILNIETGSLPMAVRQVSIFNMQGHLMNAFPGLPANISTAPFPAGLYFLSIQMEDGQQLVRKFIKAQ